MSADNWAICPICAAEAQRQHDDSQTEDFDPYALPATFREDWEMGVWDPLTPEATVIYTGKCKTCGASARINTILIVEGGPTPKPGTP